MANLPQDIWNQALDQAAIDFVIGDPNEGTKPAEACRRNYRTLRRSLLRAAHWDFARASVPMLLLADATGQTPNVGRIVPQPWNYEYALPTDSLKVRFVPWTNYATPGGQIPQGNIVPPDNSVPLTGGLNAPPVNQLQQVPARFLVTQDSNYIPDLTNVEWWEIEGVSPTGRVVICTNVYMANVVYTRDVVYPNMWDDLFRTAMVALLAQEIAVPLAKDKKEGMAMRNQNIAIAKEKISAARATNANEGWVNTDHVPDFIRVRNTGSWGNQFGNNQWGGGGGAGVFGYGWDSIGFAGNTSAY